MTVKSLRRSVITQKQGASNRTARQINRNLVFHLIRTYHPVSRAEISRLSGLQRSTVSLIVEDLLRHQWIREGSSCIARGSPTFLELNRDRAVIAIDLRPSKATVAAIDFGGRILSETVIMQPPDPRDAARLLVDATVELMAAQKGRPLDGVGISVIGRTYPSSDKLAPKADWLISPIRSSIQEATGLRVVVDNVANACALSEVWFGNSAVGKDLVAVDVSDVIVSGIFANGRLLRGARGMAGDFSHVKIDPGGARCDCGMYGCWQSVASNGAALRYYKEISGDMGLQSPKNFASLAKLARAQNSYAIRAIEKMAIYLGQGLRVIASTIAPHEVVIVGELTTAWSILGPAVEATLEKNAIAPAPKLRPIIDAKLARLRSAVALVMKGDVI